MDGLIASNKKAHRDYAVLETLECGIELKGSEVKSMRLGKMNLEDSFARIENNEVMLYNTHISPYAQASYLNVEPKRPRKLLLRKAQIKKLAGRIAQKGFTLVPLKAYFNQRGFAKIELALCRGKKLYDRREDMKRRETEMEMRRAIKNRRK
ncbi:MAG: SsrA-binding protein SmpB [Candidatus Omnitrophica bacterium]|nr:SsrA-binding protein SmpB [Candidatus Omnitrophota bacterium]MDD5553581.1 SsrA-binding protein SmpB [Candidatus Omnitrophota bacterium]